MKAHQLILGVAFAALSVAQLCAQSITPQPGYSASELFHTDAGENISALDADSSHVYYLLQRAAASTLLVRRDAADNYATPTVLNDLGGPVFGSFVRVDGGKLYFGEGSAGVIRTFDLGTSAVAPLATVDGDYDLAIGGGFGWLSANPGFAGSKIIRLDLTTGATTNVLTSSDFSGPVAFDAGGSLYYGATGFVGTSGIYKYTAAELSAGGLSLDAAHKWKDNQGNGYFDSDGVSLLQTDFASLSLYSFSSGAVTTLATSNNFFGSVSLAGGAALAAVTDFGAGTPTDDRSAVFAVVPEPGSMLLAGLGVAVVALRRKRA